MSLLGFALERPVRAAPRLRHPPPPSRATAPARVPAIAAGQLCLVAVPAAAALSSAAQRLLVTADVVIYDPGLAPFPATALGGYAEAAVTAADMPAAVISERALRFARDGWSVVQLVAAPLAAKRGEWLRRVAEQLVATGAPADLPITLLGGAEADAEFPEVEAQLYRLGDTLGNWPEPAELTIVLGAIGTARTPQVYAFAANGLAG
jgi:hypothetical protein